MIIEMEKKIKVVYEKYWVVRIIQDTGNKKVVYNEVEYDREPTDEEIISNLVDVPRNCFISVEKNYRFVRG